MVLRCCNVVVAISVTWLAAAYARAQPIFSSAVSIDCTVLNADVVVVGRVVGFSEVEPIDNRPAHAVTIAALETLKGEHQHRRLIRYTNLENSLLAKTKGNPHRLLLVAAQGDPPVERQTIDLYDEELHVLAADFTLLRKPDVVIRSAKEALRRMPGVTRIETFDLDVPLNLVEGTTWAKSSGLRLSVPVDDRLEARARGYLGDKNSPRRIEGARAVRYFKSDKNIERVKSLLNDPAWGYGEHAENNFGIEVRYFGVRAAAYETLNYWGVVVAAPVLYQEVEKLDSVHTVILSDSHLSSGELKKLARFKNLKEAYLKNTQATDTHLQELSAYTDLEGLDLANTQVTDAGLAHLTALKRLRYVLLDVTKVTDAGLKELAQLASLEHVYISGTQVTDAGLKELSTLKNLTLLDVSNTQVSDAALEDLAAMMSLKQVYLRATRVTPAGIAGLVKLRPDLKIDR